MVAVAVAPTVAVTAPAMHHNPAEDHGLTAEAGTEDWPAVEVRELVIGSPS
jgi:hypothetical protein